MTKSYMMAEAYRTLAREFLTSSPNVDSDQVPKLEQMAWDHSSKKYPIVIRRLCSGITLDEAIAELEPIEHKQEEEIMVEGSLQCPKCKGRKIHRIEKQTRSADESATVFCYCSECGKRWKF